MSDEEMRTLTEDVTNNDEPDWSSLPAFESFQVGDMEADDDLLVEAYDEVLNNVTLNTPQPRPVTPISSQRSVAVRSTEADDDSDHPSSACMNQLDQLDSDSNYRTR